MPFLVKGVTMSEAWRRKMYYRTRVLIGTNDVIESPFPDTLLCLTGQELAILRNLTEYAHRRSTFASDYEEGYYLAPTNEEWETLDAIVAELENKLMGCPELEQMLEDMLAAMQCVCNGTSLQHSGPLVSIMYQTYIEAGDIIWEDTFQETTESEDPTRCAIAQLTWALCYEILTEIVQPAQNAAQDLLFPAAYALIVAAMGSPIALLPAGALYLVLNAFIDAWVDGQLANVVNALVSNKQELVCAVYIALDGGSYRDAEAAAKIVIEAIPGISPVDKILFRASFAPWAMGAAAKAWENQTAWAIANVTPGYCTACHEIPLPLGYSLVPCIIEAHEQDDFPWLTWTITGDGTHVSTNEVVYSEPYIIGLDCDYQFTRPAGAVGWVSDNVMTGDYHQGAIWHSTITGKFGNMVGGRLFWAHTAQGDNNRLLVTIDGQPLPQEVIDAIDPDVHSATLDLGRVTTENTMHGYNAPGEKTTNWTETLYWVIEPD